MLPIFLRRQLAESRSHSLIRRFVILPVTALFAMSEPVWRLAHFFTPDALHVFLAVLGVYGLVRFRRTLYRRWVIFAYIAMGLLCVEDPLGFAEIFAVTIVMTRDAFALKNSGEMLSTTYVTLYAFLQRLLLLVAIFAFGAGIVVTGRYFLDNSGLVAAGGVGSEAIIDFLRVYLYQVPRYASAGGWLYFLGFGPIILIVASMLLGYSLNVEKILYYRHALCYIGAGLLAYLQLVTLPLFWIWQSNHGPDMISSSLLLVALMIMSAFTLAAALMVLMVEVFYRHYERFAGALFHDAPEDFVEELEAKRKRRLLKATWVIAISVPYVLVALSAVWLVKPAERGMYAAVGEYIRLAADDCAGSPIAITDGSADAALEFEMWRRGVSDFKTLSLMSDRSNREVFMRRRGETDHSEDWIALGISTSAALRDWVHAATPRSTNLTVQIGFEFWRRDRRPMPVMGATAGRTDGLASETQSNLVARAHALGDRMVALAGRGAPFVTSDTQLRELWNFALWRLARAARLRSDAADAVGETDRSLAETAFADALDDANPAYQKVRRHLEWVPRQVGNRFTPREGLNFALRQADFTMASTYARQILAKSEDDFHANFAMGMYYVMGEQYSRALAHLERANRANPSDPAALNNLATVEMHLGRLDRALKHAEAALALAPKTSEIRQTVARVKRLIEKADRDNAPGGQAP